MDSPDAPADPRVGLPGLHQTLRELMDRDESQLATESGPPSTLFAHALRVATIARQLAQASPGVSPEDAYLAGLFHDAGKFSGGRYHEGEVAEEELSMAVARRVLPEFGFGADLSDRVATAIRDLYQESNPGLLTRIVHDADNLDKLGFSGVANFFIKSGLRGRGLGPDLLFKISVELTYARQATRALLTAAGRALATQRAAQSERFFLQLLAELSDDGLFDFTTSTVTFDGVELVLVKPVRCECGGEFDTTVASQPTFKCTELHVCFACNRCPEEHWLRFCRPRTGPAETQAQPPDRRNGAEGAKS